MTHAEFIGTKVVLTKRNPSSYLRWIWAIHYLISDGCYIPHAFRIWWELIDFFDQVANHLHMTLKIDTTKCKLPVMHDKYLYLLSHFAQSVWGISLSPVFFVVLTVLEVTTDRPGGFPTHLCKLLSPLELKYSLCWGQSWTCSVRDYPSLQNNEMQM